MKARHGQVALYLVAVLVAIAVLVFMNVDVFLAIRAKNHATNAGDAAAIAAAIPAMPPPATSTSQLRLTGISLADSVSFFIWKTLPAACLFMNRIITLSISQLRKYVFLFSYRN